MLFEFVSSSMQGQEVLQPFQLFLQLLFKQLTCLGLSSEITSKNWFGLGMSGLANLNLLGLSNDEHLGIGLLMLLLLVLRELRVISGPSVVPF